MMRRRFEKPGRWAAAALLALSGSLSPAQADSDQLPGPVGLGGIVDPAARWELVSSAECFTEGIANAPDGLIYYSDIMSTADCAEGGPQEGAILAFDPASMATQVFRSPSGQSNGLVFTATGDLLVAQGADFGGRRVSRIDMQTGRSHILAHSYAGRRLNSPNDLVVGPDGLIYFSDPRYAGYEAVEQPIQGVYRIEQDRSVTAFVTDASKPNGLAFSPDGKTLYVAAADDNGSMDYTRHLDKQATHTGFMALLAYPILGDGSAGKRSILVSYEGVNTAGPDGLNVDSEGNIYVALFGIDNPGIFVYAPDGSELGHFPTGGVWPTNTELVRDPGGTRYLYMTGGNALYRIEVLAEAGSGG